MSVREDEVGPATLEGIARVEFVGGTLSGPVTDVTPSPVLDCAELGCVEADVKFKIGTCVAMLKFGDIQNDPKAPAMLVGIVGRGDPGGTVKLAVNTAKVFVTGDGTEVVAPKEIVFCIPSRERCPGTISPTVKVLFVDRVTVPVYVRDVMPAMVRKKGASKGDCQEHGKTASEMSRLI